MSDIKRKFSFTSSALPDDSFEVVSFNGTEGLSKLYRFEITLVSENDSHDLENIIQSRSRLTILRDDGNIVFNGILTAFEQLETVMGLTHYRAVLAPVLWRQTLTHHNQIFLGRTYPEIIESALKDGGLTSLDYELRLTGEYEQHEYICQYNESHYSFVSRLMEREGIYFFFEQGDHNEKVIITDSAVLHSVMEAGVKMYYSQASGLDESYREEVIKSLVCSQKILPARVLLKDYNYRKPSLELTAEFQVSERGLGDVFIYGEHFSTPEEGKRLAKVRAEALKCRARVFQGESLIPYLRPGYLFDLVGHNRKDFNITYLTTDITHSGDQAFMLNAGLAETASSREHSLYYRNSFTAINAESQYRPERSTEKPKISGTINAHIDGEANGQYAEIDKDGRYKVRMPFDLSGAKGGKGSSWLRMAQPYAAGGNESGMHFPLHKGTEVLLTFIDGDPDRPIIAAAVPNPQFPSPINENNSSQNRLKSAGGNELHMEDDESNKRILLNSPKHNSWIRMGAPNDPPGFLMPKLVYDVNNGGGGATEKGTLKITIEPEEVHDHAICTVTKADDATFQAITLKNDALKELAPGDYTLTYNHIGDPYTFEPSKKNVTVSANKISEAEAFYRETQVEKDLDDTNAKLEEMDEKQKEMDEKQKEMDEKQNEMDEKQNEQAAEKKKEEAREGGLRLNTEGKLEFSATMENKMIRGEKLEIVLGSAYDVLIGTETSFKVGAALEMFLGMKMDLALATNIEYGFGLWHTHFNENELCGNHSVEINAGGSSPLLDKLVASMAVLAAIDTAIVAGIGFGQHDLPDDDGKKEWFVNANGVAYLAALAALDAAVFISQKQNPIQYKSRIELNEHEIEIKSPEVIIKGETINVGNAATLLPPVLVTATLNLKGVVINIGRVADPATTGLNLKGTAITIGDSANTTTMDLKASTMNIGEGSTTTSIKGRTVTMGEGSTTTDIKGSTVTMGEGSTTTNLMGTTVNIGTNATTLNLKGQTASVVAAGQMQMNAQLIKLG